MPEKTIFTNRRSEIAGVPVARLAEEFGTPLYVYDAAKIKERIADLAMFDTVRYAQKACSSLAILKLVRKAGAAVDAVSAMEIRRAVAAGWPVTAEKPEDPDPIVYTADIFDRDALDLIAGEYPVHVNCGSMDMIWQLGQRAPGREITLRLNPGFGHGHSQKTNTGGDQSKHGIWHEDLMRAIELASHFDLKVKGLHMHIGSGTDLEHLATVCEAMDRAGLAAGPRISVISCGGGLPVPYDNSGEYVDLAAYYKIWREKLDLLAKVYRHPIRLEIEPGRYIVAESGYLVSEIRAVKNQGGNLFYLADAGFNNLARPVMYGSHHPISVAGPSADAPEADVIVGGPLCESGDIFTQKEGGYVEKRRLPKAEVGDYLVFEVAGAYGFMMGSNYNSKPLAAEVLIEDGVPRLIRKRQSFSDLISCEVE
ncbi:MAG: diaminopimelate decarboxylase [Thermoguttaceae bacterium]|nr:diaminopimelate decarboxylase [Thermoguttaceae bacterium]